MRFFIGLLLIILLTFPFYYFLPDWWWSGVVIVAIAGFALQIQSILSFLCGGLALGLFYGGMAYWSDAINNSMLSTKMAQVIPVGSGQNLLIAVVLIYFILGSLAMLSAKLLRDIVSGPVTKPTKKHRGKYR